MVSTYLLTVVARSRYKIFVFLILCLISCKEEQPDSVETTGFSLDSKSVFVDAVTLDSICKAPLMRSSFKCSIFH